MNLIKTSVVSFVLFLVFDFIWLGFVMKSFNNAQLSEIARMSNGEVSPNKVVGLMVYVAMALSMSLFVAPKLNEISLLASFAWGAALGFCIYSVYDLTNLAVLKNYPVPFAIADIAWGTFLYGAVAVIISVIPRKYL